VLPFILPGSARVLGWYLDSVLTAGTGSTLNEGVAHVDDSTDSVGIGMQLCLKGLVLLVFALKIPNQC
jgi:hypothetical protein